MQMNSSVTIERKRVDCSALPKGWQREEILRKAGISAGKIDVYYYSPTGKRIDSKPQLARYLGDTYDISCFDFQNGKIVKPAPPTNSIAAFYRQAHAQQIQQQSNLGGNVASGANFTTAVSSACSNSNINNNNNNHSNNINSSGCSMGTTIININTPAAVPRRKFNTHFGGNHMLFNNHNTTYSITGINNATTVTSNASAVGVSATSNPNPNQNAANLRQQMEFR